MTWQTGTATDYKDLLTKLVQVATGNHLDTATVAAGGTGYTVGDILTLTTGTFSFAATLEVLTAPAGIVGTVRIVTGGAYTANPTSPTATTGGTGTGCTITTTFVGTGWTTDRNTTPGGEMEVIMHGNGSGSDTIYVGIKTYQVLSQNAIDTAFNWTCVGMTGFNTGLTFDQQPGVSPGAIPVSTGGAYVPLKTSDAFPIGFWFSVTGRRIIVVAKVENASITHYVSAYLGWLNPFGTSTEFPYPIYVSGSTARHDTLWKITSPSISGITEMVGISGRTGPGFWRDPLSTWQSVRNSSAVDSGSPTRVSSSTYVVYPAGQVSLTNVATEDLLVADGNGDWDDFIPNSGIPGTATIRFQPTPNTAGALHWLVPATLQAGDTVNLDIYGELDDVYWVSASDGKASGDTVTISGQKYRVFQNGNRTTEFSFMAIKEN